MKAFSELKSKQKAIEVLRWICVLPAAFIANQVPYIIGSLFRPPAVVQQPGFVGAGPPSDFRRLVALWILIPLTAAAFVIAGSLVAPRFRTHVAIALAALFTLTALLSHVLLRLPGTPNYDHFAAAALAAVAAAGLIFYFGRRR